ncbi:MAG: IPExxxVDY family protein, partial [Bacteroidales bacterium]|nr:IPExxxVDY family protein [Bacteroidales bacterium]
MKIRLQQSQPTTEEYLMIGVSSSLRDYQLSYYLNKHFQTFFLKLDDIPLYNKKGLIGEFSFFHYYDEDLRMDYYLFSNKSNAKIAVLDYKHFEFFILFKLSSFLIPIKDILVEMRQVPGI